MNKMRFDVKCVKECPECRELMPALLLNDLNKCDNCGCPAHLFDGG